MSTINQEFRSKKIAEIGALPPSSGTSADAEEITRLLNDLYSRKFADRPINKVYQEKSETDQTKSTAEKLFDSLANVKLLTSQVAMHLDPDWRRRLFEQLDDLLNVEDWHDEDLPLKVSSFETFLRLMIFFGPLQRPGLGISDRGYLVAAWTNSNGRLTVEFLPNDIIRWVLSREIGEEIERAAGETQVRRFMEVLAPYQPDRWFRSA